MGIIQDFVDPDLTDFIYKTVEKYREFLLIWARRWSSTYGCAVDISPVKTQCGYACSDHASFRKAGYQSAFA